MMVVVFLFYLLVYIPSSTTEKTPSSPPSTTDSDPSILEIDHDTIDKIFGLYDHIKSGKRFRTNDTLSGENNATEVLDLEMLVADAEARNISAEMLHVEAVLDDYSDYEYQLDSDYYAEDDPPGPDGLHSFDELVKKVNKEHDDDKAAQSNDFMKYLEFIIVHITAQKIDQGVSKIT